LKDLVVKPIEETSNVIFPVGTFNEKLPSALVTVLMGFPLTETVAAVITLLLVTSFTTPVNCRVCANKQ
jgi:hypothetical protein